MEEAQKKNLMQLSEHILELLDQGKLYTHEGLTVKDIADKLNTKPYLISKAINHIIGKTFITLINEYRVQEVKRLIKDAELDHYTLLGIGYEAGFTSKTAFNTTFKSFTGITPSQFKKSLRVPRSKMVA